MNSIVGFKDYTFPKKSLTKNFSQNQAKDGEITKLELISSYMIGEILPKVGFEAYYLDQLFAMSGLSLARDYLS
jgi:hypothetical protein